MKQLISIFPILFSIAVSAQDISNFRQKILSVTDTVVVDSLSIIPNSFFIENIDTSFYKINYSEAQLFWLKKPEADSVKISYRVFPIALSKTFQHKNISRIETGAKGLNNPFSYTMEKSEPTSLFTPGLNKQGSISRGISFGNNQDLSVNSNLNLQLSGRLTENVNVLAAITDDNIPIQPEGNTQQLQDFDQVYIQLYNEKVKLTAGDFQLRSGESYFMKYFKKARGVSVGSGSGSGSRQSSVNFVQASAAISRGKFARYVVQGIEGNQGPYRLKGAENESFIIVLSGTEMVYMDGQLLLRGQENDYVIDYNTAEITFTAKRLITKDRRIIVEFQYSAQNYARSLFNFSDEFSSQKLKLRFHLYSEQDSKNQPLQADLSDEQKALLSGIGDSLQNAFSPNAQNVGFSNSEVRYKMIDSLGYDSVFVYSTNADSAVFRLGFSNVGAANGDYIQIASSANGRVFQWLAPDTADGKIVKKGNFEPLTFLVTPKKKQMGTFAGDYSVSKNTKISFEIAGSNNDVNTFSNKNSNDNKGYAGKFTVANKTPFGVRDTAPLSHGEQSGKKSGFFLLTSASYEKTDKNFSFIEWFRSPEFDRDWNLRGQRLTSVQHLPSAEIGLEKKERGTIRYLFNSYISENEYKGFKNNILSTIKTKSFDLNFNGSLLHSDGFGSNAEFLRNKSNATKRFKYFTVGGRNDYEKNLFRNSSKDTLLANSYEFLEWEIFLSNADSAKNKYILSYDQRTDYALKDNRVAPSTFGEFISFGYEILKNENSRLSGKSIYRKLKIVDTTITAQKPDNTLLNRVEYSLKIFKGAITSSSFYEIGSGLEAKKEFSFIEVPSGQGVYAWNDYNSNGIKELNEFEISAFPDQARYIKVVTLTNELVKTYTNQFNQSLFMRPDAVWNHKTGMRKFIARFSNQFAFRIDRKTTRENAETAYNPFVFTVADTNLLTLNSSLRNTFYFNRTHPKFSCDFNYQNSQNKTLLTNGFEMRENIFKEISMRWNLTNDFLLNVVSGSGHKSNQSEFFGNRNFLIDYYKVQPKITFQPGITFRISVFYEHTEKSNHVDYGGEKALNKKIGSELKVNSVGKGSLMATVNFIQIRYASATNTSLAFEMLEGLLPGNNITWNVSYQRTLANNLQLSLNYSGRSSEHAKVIHAGGVQVRAFF